MTPTNLNWTNFNSIRDYPFYGDCSMLPHGAIIDAMLVARASNDIIGLKIFQKRGELMCASFYLNTTGEEIAVATSFSTEDRRATVVSTGSIDVSGHVNFGELEEDIRVEQPNIFLLPHCSLMTGENVVNLIKVAGSHRELRGDVTLNFIEGFEVKISDVASDLDSGVDHEIEISLVDPEAFLPECAEPETVCDCPYPPMKQINTVFPDENGNISIVIKNDEDRLVVEANEDNENRIDIGVELPSTEICLTDQHLPLTGGKMPLEED